jgi:hypothetical protein
MSARLRSPARLHPGAHVDAPRHLFDDTGGGDARARDMLIGGAAMAHRPAWS